MAAKILGQAVGTGAQAALYTVPAGKETVCSTLVAVNTGTVVATVRVSAAKAGAADTAAHRLVTDQPLDPGQRLGITEGWTLAAGDVIRFTAPAAVAVTLFGSEISA